MLDAAVAAYLEHVGERAFDEPLIALLRAHGYTDVHLVHGGSEYGKDTIAKRGGCQFAFQSKAGDINLSGWRGLTGQLDELRRNRLSHPAFDLSLPRQCVLVTTGRLNSPASLAAQDYDGWVREHGEPGLTVWTADRLTEMLLTDPSAALRESADASMLALLADIEDYSVDMDKVEVFSERWLDGPLAELAGIGTLELGLVADRLVATNRLDLACHLCLAMVRGAWAANGDRDGAAVTVADAAAQLFDVYALQLRAAVTEVVADRRGLLFGDPPSNWVTYPARATRTGELLGLLALRQREQGDVAADATTKVLAQLVETHPGTAHPISDRYATCAIPMVLALSHGHRDHAVQLVRWMTSWLADRYDPEALGLAASDATAERELQYLLGSPFEFIDLRRRQDSYLAAVLGDLAAVLEDAQLYDDVRNETLAVRVVATLVQADDRPTQFRRSGVGVVRVMPAEYTDTLPEDSVPAAHHRRSEDGVLLVRLDRSWDLLAVQSVLRDRHWVAACRSHMA